MAEIKALTVKELRERTGVGMMECKQALVECDGDMDKAVEYLQKRAAAKAVKRVDRAATEGQVSSYIHGNGRIGVLIEVNCETDFTARNDAFGTLARDLCLHIAASGPEFVSPESIPEAELEKQRSIFEGQAKEEGKPEQIWDKIVTGRMDKWLKEICLVNQPWFRDGDKTVAVVLQEIIAQTGENIKVRRFVRWDLGEAL